MARPHTDLRDPPRVAGDTTRDLTGFAMCFAAGTRIAVPGGTCPVQDLRSGDLVETVDGGVQPVVWAGGGPVLTDAANPSVRLATGVMGADRPLRVLGGHLLLFRNSAAELLFGEAEVLIAAQDLLGLPGVTQDRSPRIMGYYHVLMPHHDLLIANGVVSESQHPGRTALSAMPHRVLADLHANIRLEEVAHLAQQPAARRILLPHEARVLLAMLHDGDAQSRLEVLLG